VPGVVGFGGAARRAEESRPTEAARLVSLRGRLIDGVLGSIPDVRLTGSRNRRLPNNVHLCIEGVEGESILLALDAAGIAASAGSACSSGSVEPSHVLLAIGLPVETARGALRMTLGKSTTAEAIDYTVDRLRTIVRELRALS
jgi:cysteine desulfurase